MEMKYQAQTSPFPSQPPPYTPQESSSPAVIVIPPAVTHEATTTLRNTAPEPIQRTVVTSNIVIPKKIGPIATPYICQSCNQMIVTKVEASATIKQHLFALLLCAIGCWPCVIIPYCMPSCRKAEHFCPLCNSYIGTYT